MSSAWVSWQRKVRTSRGSPCRTMSLLPRSLKLASRVRKPSNRNARRAGPTKSEDQSLGSRINTGMTVLAWRRASASAWLSVSRKSRRIHQMPVFILAAFPFPVLLPEGHISSVLVLVPTWQLIPIQRKCGLPGNFHRYQKESNDW